METCSRTEMLQSLMAALSVFKDCHQGSSWSLLWANNGDCNWSSGVSKIFCNIYYSRALSDGKLQYYTTILFVFVWWYSSKPVSFFCINMRPVCFLKCWKFRDASNLYFVDLPEHKYLHPEHNPCCCKYAFICELGSECGFWLLLLK